MNFLAPGRLWLLVVVAALAAAYVVVQRRRRHYAARFTNLDLLASVAPKRPGWRRHVAAAAMLAALVVLVASWARPTRRVRRLVGRPTAPWLARVEPVGEADRHHRRGPPPADGDAAIRAVPRG